MNSIGGLPQVPRPTPRLGRTPAARLPDPALNVQRGVRIRQNGTVQFWKPHALATPHDGQIDLKIGDRVKATIDLHGVPAGTEGKVLLANGFNWQRYRILFDNGVEMSDLDHRNLEPIGRTAKRLAKKAKIAARGA